MKQQGLKILVTAGTIWLCLLNPLAAQTWPTRPVRVIVGFPAGGGIEVVARLLSVRLADSIGQSVIVDNRPGANGIVATDLVAKANPDGHTLLIGTTGNLSVNTALIPNLPFNVERDFAPIMQTSSVPFLLYMNPKIPAQSVEELIALIKAQPGKINFYSSGNGSLPHLTGELLNTMVSMHAIHVPYKGSAPGFNDLIGGQVQFGFDAVPIGLQHVKAGRVRALATTGPKRLSFLPEVAAVNESIKGFEVVNWYGMVAPVATPKRVIEKLYHELIKAMNHAETRDKLIAQGTDPVPSDPQSFKLFIQSETLKWGKVIQQAHIVMN